MKVAGDGARASECGVWICGAIQGLWVLISFAGLLALPVAFPSDFLISGSSCFFALLVVRQWHLFR